MKLKKISRQNKKNKCKLQQQKYHYWDRGQIVKYGKPMIFFQNNFLLKKDSLRKSNFIKQ